MGAVVENSISHIKKNYPELTISRNGKYIDFIGRFVIQAYYQDIVVDIAPRLHIKFPINYPESIPYVFDLYGKYKNEHILNNEALCVATEFDLILQLCNSVNIRDYIDKFLIPYFISYQGKLEKGIYVFGDRSPGIEGIYQSIADFFNIKEYKREIIQDLLLWAIRIQPFFKTYPDPIIRYRKQTRYSRRIGVLRKLGIKNLKKIYKVIKGQEELLKQYYEYMKVEEE